MKVEERKILMPSTDRDCRQAEVNGGIQPTRARFPELKLAGECLKRKGRICPRKQYGRNDRRSPIQYGYEKLPLLHAMDLV